MHSFKHILVPVDFNEPSAGALEAAAVLAAKFDAQLTLLHVYADPISSYGYTEGISWPTEAVARAARAELDLAVTKVKASCPNVEGVLACGDPSRKILEAIEKSGADVVVMGTHGRRGLTRVMLGSVAEKVLRLSRVPVLVVRGDEKKELGTGAPVGGWL